MNEDLTVYTLPGCVQCRATERALEDAGVTFTVVDLATDERAAEEVGSAPGLVDVLTVRIRSRWKDVYRGKALSERVP